MSIAITTLVLIQALGSAVGALGSVVAELSYFRALKDGRIDSAERAHLSIIVHTLRTGMLIVLASSVGLVLVDFMYENPLQPALTSTYWIQMVLAFVIIWASWAVSRRKVPFALGSAAAFTGWWLLAFLALGQVPTMSFLSAFILYILSTAIMTAVLAYARILATPK